jgi:hypothetical protein
MEDEPIYKTVTKSQNQQLRQKCIKLAMTKQMSKAETLSFAEEIYDFITKKQNDDHNHTS